MRVDWPSLLRLGLGLGLAPPVLWQLGVREWRALVAGPQPLTWPDLQALSRQFPDDPPPDDASDDGEH